MTRQDEAKERVLTVWPRAEFHVPWDANAGAIFRDGNEKYGAVHLSDWFKSEAEAWADAASKLPAPLPTRCLSCGRVNEHHRDCPERESTHRSTATGSHARVRAWDIEKGSAPVGAPLEGGAAPRSQSEVVHRAEEQERAQSARRADGDNTSKSEGAPLGSEAIGEHPNPPAPSTERPLNDESAAYAGKRSDCVPAPQPETGGTEPLRYSLRHPGDDPHFWAIYDSVIQDDITDVCISPEAAWNAALVATPSAPTEAELPKRV